MKIRLYIFCFVWSYSGSAQELIKNGGFEIGNPPECSGHMEACSGWNNTQNGGSCSVFSYGTPDYFRSNAIDPSVQTPNVFTANIYPHSGDALVGMTIFQSNHPYREYISSDLVKPLEYGKKYNLSVYVSHGYSPHECYLSSDNFQVYFSHDQPIQDLNYVIHKPPLPFPPINNLVIGVDSILHDSDWVKLSFDFEAIDTFKIITIGNFQWNSNTQFDSIFPGLYNCAYYFIDDVSMKKSIQFYPDTIVCRGDSVQLINESGFDDYYWWIDTNTGDTIGKNESLWFVPDSGQIVLLENEVGDSFTRKFHLVDYPTVYLPADTATCLDAYFINASSNANTLMWSTGESSEDITVNETGSYTIEVSNEYCTSSDDIYVEFNQIDVTLGNDTVICYGSTTELNSDQPGEYLWSNGQTATTIEVNEEGIYWLFVDHKGCTDSDTITISMNYGAKDLYVPKVFSPNADGYNDYFEISNDEFLTNLDLKIYNRWGQQVYQQNETYGKWDGRNFSAVESPPGVYFWVLTYDSNCDEGKLTGTVSLVR